MKPITHLLSISIILAMPALFGFSHFTMAAEIDRQFTAESPPNLPREEAIKIAHMRALAKMSEQSSGSVIKRKITSRQSSELADDQEVTSHVSSELIESYSAGYTQGRIVFIDFLPSKNNPSHGTAIVTVEPRR